MEGVPSEEVDDHGDARAGRESVQPPDRTSAQRTRLPAVQTTQQTPVKQREQRHENQVHEAESRLGLRSVNTHTHRYNDTSTHGYMGMLASYSVLCQTTIAINKDNW